MRSKPTLMNKKITIEIIKSDNFKINSRSDEQ